MSTSIMFLQFFIQFLGRDKDDGVRRSAVSGKKVISKRVGGICDHLFLSCSFVLDTKIKSSFLWCRFCWNLTNQRRTRPQKTNAMNCWSSWMLVLTDGGQDCWRQKEWTIKVIECYSWLMLSSLLVHGIRKQMKELFSSKIISPYFLCFCYWWWMYNIVKLDSWVSKLELGRTIYY